MDRYRVSRSRVHLTHRQLKDQLLAAVEPVLFGPPQNGARAVRELEAGIAAAVRRRHAVAVHSGTAGLFLALRACGVGPGDEVVTVANSDVSTIAAISHCGATPVLCDVGEADHTMDPGDAARCITARTRVLLPVDLYGHPADLGALRALADRHGLRIVDDACLALGARDGGLAVGAQADAAVYSFAAFKPLGSAGHGGMVVTDDDTLAHELRLLAGYGADPSSPHPVRGYQAHRREGYNLTMDPLEAAVVSTKLPHLEDWTVRRRRIAERYAAGLRDTPVIPPTFRPGVEPTFRCYTVRIPQQRDAVFGSLLDAGVEVVLHYVPPLHRQPVYAARGLRRADALPVTEMLAAQLLGLPVSPELGDGDVDYVIAQLRGLLSG